MRTISGYQQAVYDAVATGSGNVVVQARAGAGKTTTIMGALACVPSGRTIALFAFNKSIAVELGRRAPKGVEVKTLHAHGFSSVRRAFTAEASALGDRFVNDKKSVAICEELFGPADPDHAIRSRYAAIADAVCKAKDTLIGKDDLDALDSLIDDFEIDCPEGEDLRAAFVQAAMAVLKKSADRAAIAKHGIDFSDMCWLPVVLGLRVWAFDFVFVDETQDLSPCQIELLLMCVRRGGRIVAVGDDRQAIYAFRGADVNTMPNLIERLDAKVLPLSITYRCCRAVTALAATEVPDFTPADNAIEGAVTPATDDRMLAAAQPGDMVISRANAPLMSYCLKLLASGKRATIKGRDVGKGIKILIEKSKARSIPALIEWIDRWHKKETARLAKREKPTTEIDDKRACVIALTEGAKGVPEVHARIESLFSEGGDEKSVITLGTTHKLKGLEAERVWMLADTYRKAKGGEEANCWYVAVTRAKRELFMVCKPDAAAPKAAAAA